MTRQTRALLIDRDGPRCRWCGRLTVDPAEVGQTADEAATVDHLVPRVDGGSKRDIANLVLACHRCNDDRGRLPVEDWLAVLRRRGLDPSSQPAARLLYPEETDRGHSARNAPTAGFEKRNPPPANLHRTNGVSSPEWVRGPHFGDSA